MDPNEALRRIREITGADMRAWKSRGHWAEVEELVDLFDELDAHLSVGGRPPTAWAEGPDAPELDGPRGVCGARLHHTHPRFGHRLYVCTQDPGHYPATDHYDGVVNAPVGRWRDASPDDPLGGPHPGVNGDLPEHWHATVEDALGIPPEQREV